MIEQRITGLLRKALLAAALLAPFSAQAQEVPDRSDPAVIQRERETREAPVEQRPRLRVEAPERGTAAASGQEVVVGAIRVSGATQVSTAAFAGAIEPYLGRPLSHGDLVRLATDVATVLRRAGYGLATAWIPAQDLSGGVLVVQVDEGRIDEIRASGPSARLVEQRLAGVTGGGPVRTAELERQLMLIGDLSGLLIGDVRVVRERGRSILTVATRYQRVHGRVTVDNWGTSAVGPVRAWAEINGNGFMMPGDGLTLGLGVTPFEPQEFQFVEGRYRMPVGTGGTTFGIAGFVGHTRSDDGAGGDFEGLSSQVELEVVHPIERTRRASLWVAGRFELRDSDLDRDGLLIRNDRIAALSASAFGYARLAGGRMRTRVTVVQGVQAFDATRFGDPLASRADASGTFTKLEAWADYTRPIGGGFSIALATTSQIADGPLLSSEEMGLGGPQFLRAWDYRERSGDEGAAASAELRFDLKDVARHIDQVQLYTFIDGGRVRNLGPVGTRSGDLASVGGGARVTIAGDWRLGAEIGVPLTDGAFNADPKPRFSFSIGTRF